MQQAEADKKAQQDADKAKEDKALEDATNDDPDEGADDGDDDDDGDEAGTLTYSDPDAAANAQVVLPTAKELEARLNQNKRPVNPNGGGGSPQIDASSPPPQSGGLDPTIAYFDGEGSGLLGGTGVPKLSIAPITYVRGWEPPVGGPSQGGGSAPNAGKSWPQG
jgi:hypothetical protein